MNTTTQQDTLAAANKAAEEGGLPALPQAYFTRGGSYGIMLIDSYDANQLKSYARQAIAADRASRQVANKAAQETRAAYKDRPTYDDNVSIGSRDFFEILIEYGKEPSLSKRMEIADFVDSHIDKLVANKVEVDLSSLNVQTGADIELVYCNRDEEFVRLDDVKELLAAPPATTGASTALTDERISAMAAEIEEKDDLIARLRRQVDAAVERGVDVFGAAQAGQVAVPEGFVLVPIEPDQAQLLAGLRADPHAYVVKGIYEAMVKAAPSPAKESK